MTRRYNTTAKDTDTLMKGFNTTFKGYSTTAGSNGSSVDDSEITTVVFATAVKEEPTAMAKAERRTTNPPSRLTGKMSGMTGKQPRFNRLLHHQ